MNPVTCFPCTCENKPCAGVIIVSLYWEPTLKHPAYTEQYNYASPFVTYHLKRKNVTQDWDFHAGSFPASNPMRIQWSPGWMSSIISTPYEIVAQFTWEMDGQLRTQYFYQRDGLFVVKYTGKWWEDDG